MNKNVKCPLCQSNNILCTHLETKKLENTGETQVSVRFYCPDCKKGMTTIGVLAITGEEVDR